MNVMCKKRKELTDEQKEEKKLYGKKWREENKEKVISKQKEYYEKNKELLREKSRLWRLNNPEKSKENGKKYRNNNKENIAKRKKEYNKKNPDSSRKAKLKYRNNNLEQERNRTAKWHKDNPEYSAIYIRKRRNSDSLYKLSSVIRNSIYKSLHYKTHDKNSKTEYILGCSFEEFKIYLESKFEPWMNWENYGKYNGTLNYGWDIDHIIPLSTAKTVEDIIKLNHYTNLQPLCSYINRYIKKDNIIETD
jgi:hypothetical protein